MTIFADINNALSTLSPAVPFAGGMYQGVAGVLPDLYITYPLVIGTPIQHADDAETVRKNLVQISIFNRAGLESLPDVNTAMLAAGFMAGAVRMMPFDQQTGHFHLVLEFTK